MVLNLEGIKFTEAATRRRGSTGGGGEGGRRIPSGGRTDTCVNNSKIYFRSLILIRAGISAKTGLLFGCDLLATRVRGTN